MAAVAINIIYITMQYLHCSLSSTSPTLSQQSDFVVEQVTREV